MLISPMALTLALSAARLIVAFSDLADAEVNMMVAALAASTLTVSAALVLPLTVVAVCLALRTCRG